MTKRECAIVMAFTGVCMLTGEDFGIFHKYVEDIMGRPIYVHEMGDEAIVNEIKQKSEIDFINLCRNAESEGQEMTRLEENGMVIDEMTKRAELKPSGTYEEMATFQFGAIATMLADIAKSLAIIADKEQRRDKE